MRAKEYPALVDALESGIACGLRRADKYASGPLTPEQVERVQREVYEHVLSAICERFRFEDAPEE